MANKQYDFSIPLKTKSFEAIKSGEIISISKKYNSFFSGRIENACRKKYYSNLQHLYSEQRKVLNNNLTDDNQNFLVRFYNKKEFLILECKLTLEDDFLSNYKQRLIIKILEK